MITIEILSVDLHQGIVTILASDVSEENLQRIERMRDDNFSPDIEFQFDTHDAEAAKYLYKWLKHQKAAKSCKTWGEAIRSVVGTITTISQKYRRWQ